MFCFYENFVTMVLGGLEKILVKIKVLITKSNGIPVSFMTSTEGGGGSKTFKL